MICFNISRGLAFSGLLLTVAGDRLGVLSPTDEGIPRVIALVSDQLMELIAQGKHVLQQSTYGPTSLMECDIDCRSEVWLMPPSKKTRNDALVFAELRDINHNIRRSENTAMIRANGPAIEIYRQYSKRYSFGSRLSLTSPTEVSTHEMLARMPIGSCLKFEFTAKAKPGLMPRLFPKGPAKAYQLGWDGVNLS